MDHTYFKFHGMFYHLSLDKNQDGADDFVVLNRDASGLGTITDRSQLAWVLNLATGSASAFFYAEHSTNTGNIPELGLMLITNGDCGSGNRGGATQETEALLFFAP